MRAISSSIRRTQTPDGGVLLDIERGQIFCLNVIGSKILDLLEEGHNEGRIAEQVSAAYGTDIETVRMDVHDFLENLNQQHILEQCAPTATSEREATDGDSGPT
jgi:hypothetical protein